MLDPNTYLNLKWLIIAVSFTVTVLFLSHLPQEAIPSPLQMSDFDKVEHVLAYGVITFLSTLSLRSHISLLTAVFLFFAILGVGTIDELTQPLVNRTASLADWLANTIGVVFVSFLFIYAKHTKPQVLAKSNTSIQTFDN